MLIFRGEGSIFYAQVFSKQSKMLKLVCIHQYIYKWSSFTSIVYFYLKSYSCQVHILYASFENINLCKWTIKRCLPRGYLWHVSFATFQKFDIPEMPLDGIAGTKLMDPSGTQTQVLPPFKKECNSFRFFFKFNHIYT